MRVMTLEVGDKGDGDKAVNFAPKPLAGVDSGSLSPDELLLDGQQRLTSLYQALASNKPVDTTDARGKRLARWYYIDIAKALDLSTKTVGAYLAWNTMFDPGWIKPEVAKNRIACPACHAPMGSECRAPRTHKSRIEAFRDSSEGQKYLQTKAGYMEERYGVKTVAAS